MTAPATDRLQDVFRAVFELPEGSDPTKLRQIDTPRWDSLAHVSLVTAIESEFGVTLDAADQLRMTSYAATALLLEEKSA
jgi:acyl carrier protein